MQSRDDFSSKLDKRGDRGNESNDGSWFSCSGNINAYLNGDKKNE